MLSASVQCVGPKKSGSHDGYGGQKINTGHRGSSTVIKTAPLSRMNTKRHVQCIYMNTNMYKQMQGFGIRTTNLYIFSCQVLVKIKSNKQLKIKSCVILLTAVFE